MGELTVYTRAWCPHCLKTLAFLIQQGIPYREISLTHAPELATALVERFGHDRVPLFELDGQWVDGHSELLERQARGEFDRAPRAAAAPTDTPRPRLRLPGLRPMVPRLPGRGSSRRPPPT